MSMFLILFCLPAILASQPSLIAISLTQVGWADLNLPLWISETPNIQFLASRSITLDSLYCETSPSASNGAFLTGRDPITWGFYSSNNAEATNLKEDSGFVLPLPTLAHTLSNHTSHFIGRWWLGQRPEANPTNHGFDTFYGHVSDRGTKYDDLRYPNPGLYRNTEIQSRLYDTTNPSLDLIQEEGSSNLTELFAEEAVRFLRSTSHPYYLHLSLDATQHPAYRSPQFEGNSTRGGHYADALREIDGLVGRVLREAGDNTIVALFADSTALASHFDGGSNAPFTGEFGDSTEGGVRVPGFLYIPTEKGRRSNQVMTLADLHKTISSFFTGGHQELPNSALKGNGKTVPIFRGRTLMALRWRKYKAHVNMLSSFVPGQFVDSLTSFSFKSTGTYPILFDVLADPGERFHVGSGIGPVPEQYKDVMTPLVDDILDLYASLDMNGGLLNECDVIWREWAPEGCATRGLCLGQDRESELKMCSTPTYTWSG